MPVFGGISGRNSTTCSMGLHKDSRMDGSLVKLRVIPSGDAAASEISFVIPSQWVDDGSRCFSRGCGLAARP